MEKNKIVFALVIVCIVLFIGAYAVVFLGGDEERTVEGNQVPVPKLEEGSQKEYDSKMEALEDLKEERQVNAPSIYDEHLLDSMGYYRPELDSIHKRRMIDSVYALGEQRYQRLTALKHLEANDFQEPDRIPRVDPVQTPNRVKKDTTAITEKEKEVAAKELGLEHQLFFASDPKENPITNSHNTDSRIYVRVDGTQTIKQHYRLRMRLLKPALINGRQVPKNTLVYGFVSFKPNRTMLNIEHIASQAMTFEAYDLADGSEGIYIENSFHADARQQLVGDVVDDINVAGVPQVSSIKQLFRRNNRNVKVTVMDGYQLILKPKQ
ncbi:conjugative transposon protein TraM [Galbibacter sp. EGI 63066]|uniref:conjugative transposon protein TraM n=1 Tax=Galbibacter sp. EGI 63066 TaxID=2993559 RepID=UPI002B056419|nr:conjugative transposon protein TraM [Galbibacter sp. EGI 63066]